MGARVSIPQDYLQELDKTIRLEIIESACVYPRTVNMKEANQPAMLELIYSDLSSFGIAVKEANGDVHIRRLGYSLSIPTILGCLVDLYDTLLLDKVDSVLIHQGGTTVVRFSNLTRKIDGRSEGDWKDGGCSLFLAINDVRMKSAHAVTRTKVAAFDSTSLWVGCAIGAIAVAVTTVIPVIMSRQR